MSQDSSRQTSRTTAKIAILSSSDQSKYGDLIHPVILKALFQETNNIEAYGLTENKLFRYGGLEIKSQLLLFSKGFLQDNDLVVIPDGEPLTAQWSQQPHHLLPEALGSGFNLIKCWIPEKWLNRITRKFFKSSHKMPYLIDRNDFDNKVKVAYQAVGGNDIQKLDNQTKQYLGKKLANVDFISVKDKHSYNSLHHIAPELDITLSPDLSILLGEIYPKELLKDNCSLEVEHILDFFPNGFICFQVSDNLVKQNKGVISEQLDRLHAYSSLGVVLVPMGQQTIDNDNTVLQSLLDNLTHPASILCKSSILNIATLISQSQLFIGSSLHGNITAMAYDIPNLGIEDNVTHLQSYLNTWAIDELRDCIVLEQIAEAAKNCLGLSVKKLSESREAQIKLVHKQISQLTELIRS